MYQLKKSKMKIKAKLITYVNVYKTVKLTADY